MAKYQISWTEEDWYRVIIEASSKEEAKEMFWNSNFDDGGIKHYGTEIQTDIDCEEVVDGEFTR